MIEFHAINIVLILKFSCDSLDFWSLTPQIFNPCNIDTWICVFWLENSLSHRGSTFDFCELHAKGCRGTRRAARRETSQDWLGVSRVKRPRQSDRLPVQSRTHARDPWPSDPPSPCVNPLESIKHENYRAWKKYRKFPATALHLRTLNSPADQRHSSNLGNAPFSENDW